MLILMQMHHPSAVDNQKINDLVSYNCNIVSATHRYWHYRSVFGTHHDHVVDNCDKIKSILSTSMLIKLFIVIRGH